MTKPQQPELARSGRGETDPSSVKTRTGGPTDETPPVGAVPEDNLPGHHPAQDQDKPTGPPPKPRARPKKTDVIDLTEARQERVEESFAFDFELRLRPFALAFGVTPWTTGVDVADGELRVRFGPWSLRTPLDNVEGAEVTGPYSLVKVAGPAHLSFADRGVTFATSTKRGVCIRFKQPVPALFPGAALKHPGLTVTVKDPERLVEVLSS